MGPDRRAGKWGLSIHFHPSCSTSDFPVIFSGLGRPSTSALGKETEMKTAAADDSDEPEALQELYRKARSAYEICNYRYAISILTAVLREVPKFEAARNLLEDCKREQGRT